MGTLSIRISHRKNSQSRGQRHHDLRTSKIPAYVDQEKSELNSIIVEPLTEAQLKSICLQRRAKRGVLRKMRDGNISTVGIISFSHEAQQVINNLSVPEQDRLIKKAAEAIAEELNTTLTGLVIHRDESGIHAHFQMPAYDLNGMPLSKTVKPATTSKLQDTAGAVFSALGITRGKPKAQRKEMGDDPAKWVHRSVKELHNDLPSEIEVLQKQALEYLEKAKKYYNYIVKAHKKMLDTNAKLDDLQKRLVVYQSREKTAREAAESAEKALQEKLAVLEKLESQDKTISRLQDENRKLKAMVVEKKFRPN